MHRLIRKMRPYLLAWLHRSRSGPASLVRRFSCIIATFLHLKGFSIGCKRLLVFENIENGSLKEHLNDPLKTPLNWNTRLQIAIGVAAALEYLLLFSNPPIYHVSISASNVMLGENYIAKISDVGLHNSVGDYVTMPHSTNAEDCMDHACGNLTFQLGVLILVLITGQSSEKGSTDLIQWIQESRFRSSIPNMIDPDLGNNYDSRELKNLLAVARLCIKSGDKPKFSIPQIFRGILLMAIEVNPDLSLTEADLKQNSDFCSLYVLHMW
ncbi:hypothetical protein OIU74_001905 [Salix koriyanagi]|uniref:Protein kinase domain-containing protein n=1 Tax=Salix koriyanagi TaxID=2511006 RepID=A0A9Q0X2E3_9ROSI|nr:hypothetical protein OIU74_001905 [Salix koriyanagi]